MCAFDVWRLAWINTESSAARMYIVPFGMLSASMILVWSEPFGYWRNVHIFTMCLHKFRTLKCTTWCTPEYHHSDKWMVHRAQLIQQTANSKRWRCFCINCCIGKRLKPNKWFGQCFFPSVVRSTYYVSCNRICMINTIIEAISLHFGIEILAVECDVSAVGSRQSAASFVH